MPILPEPRTTLVRDENHEVQLAGAFVVVYWRVLTTCSAVRRIAHEVKSRARAGGEKILFIQVIDKNAKVPHSDARNALADLLRNASDSILASAVVMEGDSLRHSLGRGFVRALRILSRPAFPHEVFASIDEAIAFLDGERLRAWVP
jgi:hypothetical protein